MVNILTSEDKKYLKRLSNYMNSMGMQTGNIDFEIDNSYLDLKHINWDRVTHFDNNYRAEIPEGAFPIFRKIFRYVQESGLYRIPDVESLNFEGIVLNIDTLSKEISVSHYYTYYDESESRESEWSLEEDPDDESLVQIFQDLDKLDYDGSELVLRYNGSGDSGYIESEFDNIESVPSSVEDWAYSVLEDFYGGWEINEGSQGYFKFNIPDKSIILSHTYNTEESSNDTLYEENFSE